LGGGGGAGTDRQKAYANSIAGTSIFDL
jgi:hypothetical protein